MRTTLSLGRVYTSGPTKMDNLLNRIFPKSFAYKILFVAFLGTHVPLLAFTIYVLTVEAQGNGLNIFLLILLATLIGTGITLYAINKLLTPIFHIISNIKAFDQGQAVTPLTEDRSDEIGFLVRSVNRWIASTAVKMETFQDEAEKDPLTSILNRRGFTRSLESIKSGYVLHFDIDNFKSVNDTHGHDKGDEVLVGIAERIQNALRDRDIFARLGGEEFVIMTILNLDEALKIADRLVSEVRDDLIAGLPITVSMGVAEYSGDLEAALKNADEATYEAKKAGKDRFVCCVKANPEKQLVLH